MMPAGAEQSVAAQAQITVAIARRGFKIALAFRRPECLRGLDSSH